MVSARRMFAINRRRRQVNIETKTKAEQPQSTHKAACIELFKRRRETRVH